MYATDCSEPLSQSAKAHVCHYSWNGQVWLHINDCTLQKIHSLPIQEALIHDWKQSYIASPTSSPYVGKLLMVRFSMYVYYSTLPTISHIREKNILLCQCMMHCVPWWWVDDLLIHVYKGKLSLKLFSPKKIFSEILKYYSPELSSTKNFLLIMDLCRHKLCMGSGDTFYKCCEYRHHDQPLHQEIVTLS